MTSKEKRNENMKERFLADIRKNGSATTFVAPLRGDPWEGIADSLEREGKIKFVGREKATHNKSLNFNIYVLVGSEDKGKRMRDGWYRCYANHRPIDYHIPSNGVMVDGGEVHDTDDPRIALGAELVSRATKDLLTEDEAKEFDAWIIKQIDALGIKIR